MVDESLPLIAGPMRGYKDYNFPAFHAAAARLRADGHEVVSPAEMDEKEFGIEEAKRIAPAGEVKFREFMARDLPALLSCDAVLLLPGWEKSQGVAIEAFTAAMTGIPLYLDEKLTQDLNIYRLYVTIGEKITS